MEETNKFKKVMLENGIKLPDDKADFSHVMELIEELEKNDLVVVSGGKSCDFEPIIKTKFGKVVGHIGIRKGCHYSIERDGRPKGRYLRVNDAKTQEQEVKALLELAEKSLGKKTVKKATSTAVKSKPKAVVNGIKTVGDFKKKVESLDKSANSIHLSELTREIRRYCKEQEFPIELNTSGYIIKVR